MNTETRRKVLGLLAYARGLGDAYHGQLDPDAPVGSVEFNLAYTLGHLHMTLRELCETLGFTWEEVGAADCWLPGTNGDVRFVPIGGTPLQVPTMDPRQRTQQRDLKRHKTTTRSVEEDTHPKPPPLPSAGQPVNPEWGAGPTHFTVKRHEDSDE